MSALPVQSVPSRCLISEEARRGCWNPCNWSSWWLCAAMWVLGTEAESLVRAAGAALTLILTLLVPYLVLKLQCQCSLFFNLAQSFPGSGIINTSSREWREGVRPASQPNHISAMHCRYAALNRAHSTDSTQTSPHGKTTWLFKLVYHVYWSNLSIIGVTSVNKAS